MRSISLKHILIEQKKYVGLQFYPDKVTNALVKELPDLRWSNTYNMAVLPNTKDNITAIFAKFRGVAWINGNYFFNRRPPASKPISHTVKDIVRKSEKAGWLGCPKEYVEKLIVKKYSENTCRAYISNFEKFVNYYKDREILSLDENDVRDYILYLIDKGCSDSYLNIAINSIKFYYEAVMGMPNRFYSIDRPRKKKRLPDVISKQEVREMIRRAGNIKHRCIVSLLYSSGLRRSELINLKLSDIDSRRMVVKVYDGKGGKSRLTLLSETALNDLRRYYREWKPREYLFEGVKGSTYSDTSVCTIVKRAAVRAKIRKKVTPHVLRHSFATHLLEDGVDIRYIQSLLGHESTKTTEIYTHVATDSFKTIKNPLDL